jgi:hypothetical protein
MDIITYRVEIWSLGNCENVDSLGADVNCEAGGGDGEEVVDQFLAI